MNTLKHISTFGLLFFGTLLNAQVIMPTFVDSVIARDGGKLAVDIYVPDTNQQWSTVLVQTPYNRQAYRYIGLPLVGVNLAGSHFAFVIADWRCFYGSASACVAGYDWGKDGYDIVEWIAAQSWSNGKIGTWGPSALGKIQFQTSAEIPPHLVCGVPLVAAPQMKYQEYYPGGVYRTEYVQQLDVLGFGMSLVVNPYPVYDFVWQYLYEPLTYFPDSVFVPMLMIGGWYDHNTNLVMEFFDGIRSQSPLAVRDKHRLLMGPWAHGGFGTAQVGSANQGELYYYEAAGWSDSLALLHLEYYLNNVANGWDTTSFIKYFQMGQNEWFSTPSWPPADVSPHRLYFQNDYSLLPVVPQQTDVFLGFPYDPYDPSPTVGGATLRMDLLQGPYDQATVVEGRSDIVSFSSIVLGQNVVMKGKALVHLFFSSDRKDTDFAIRLTDVYPDGRSMLLAEGIRRARFRDGFAAADTSCIQPDTIYSIDVELPDVCITFLAGHRIRVDVSSANYPRYDCNLNNGGAMYTSGDTLVANNKVYCNLQFASYIELPIIDFYGAVRENPANEGISIFPNPVTDQFTIVTGMESGESVRIDLLGLQGGLCRTLYDGPVSNAITLKVAGITPGFYLLRVSGGRETIFEKLIITNQ